MSPSRRRQSGRVHWLLLLASLAMSLLLWFVVFAQNNLTTPVSLELRLTGLDESRYFVRNAPRMISVIATGARSQNDELMRMNAYAVADMSEVTEGAHSYRVQILPESFNSFVQESPNTVTIEIESVVTKTLPITVETTGSLPDPNYVIGDIRSTPLEATIRGPKSEVEKITKIRAVVDLSTADLTHSSLFRSELTPLTSDNRTMEYVTVSPRDAQLSAAISTAPVEKIAFIAADFTGRVADGFTVKEYYFEPRSVGLAGPSRAVAMVNQVTTEPINLNGISADTEMEVALKAPPGVQTKLSKVKLVLRVAPVAIPDPSAPPTAPPGTTGGPTPGAAGEGNR